MTAKSSLSKTASASKYINAKWAYTKYLDHYSIEVDCGLGKEPECIAELTTSLAYKPDEIVEFMVAAINQRQNLCALIDEASYALELCLGCPNLTWEAEHEAEAVYNKIKRGV